MTLIFIIYGMDHLTKSADAPIIQSKAAKVRASRLGCRNRLRSSRAVDVDQAAAASLLKVESFKLELSPYRQIEPGMGTGHEITPPAPPPPPCQEITKITTPSNGKNEYWTQNEGFPSVKNDIITDQFSKMKLYSWMMWLVIMWHVVHILIFYLLLYDTELRATSLHMMSSPAAATHNSELISITMCWLFLAPVHLFIMTTSEVLCVCTGSHSTGSFV